MKPKTRSELRSTVIDPLYKFLRQHDDLLDVESEFINSALKFLVCADSHLFHLGVSHKVASSSSEKYVMKIERIDNDSDLPF